MSNPTEIQNQQYQRMIELSDLARKRRLDAKTKGENRPRSGRKGDDYLTEEERQEFFKLGREVFGVTVKNDSVQCQGRSWQLPSIRSPIPAPRPQ